MKFRRTGLLAAAAFTLATHSTASHANGRFPATGQIALSASDPNFIVARSSYGLLWTRDHGANWDWVCELSVGFSGPEDPMLVIMKDNAVSATLSTGLVITKDNGCSWSYASDPVPRDLFIDAAGKRGDNRSAVAITSKYSGMTDAGAIQFRSELFATSDGGTTWSKVGQAFDPQLLLETVELTESNPQRIYVSAIKGSGADTQGFLLVSDDGGVTFTQRPVPLVVNEDRAPYIGAVSPTNADVVYVRTSATPGKPNRLLVSTDAGRNWTVKHQTLGAMLGFALSPDGTRVWLGSQEDGLFGASAADLVFTKKSSTQIQCLTASSEGLWACSNEVSGFVVGFSRDEGATFAPKLRLSGLRGPLECPVGSSTHDKCVPDWPRQRTELGIGTADAGIGATVTPDVGGSAVPPSSSSKCGCNVKSDAAGASVAGASGLAVLVASALAALRRRCRR